MSESNGVWGQGTEVVLPGGAELASNGDQYASLGSVSCTSAGNCAASGYYTDGSHFYQGMAVTETDGVWGPATEIVLPNNHVGGNPQAEFTSIACWGAGDCSAVGSYTDSGNNAERMTASETDGVWTQATEDDLPTNNDGTGGFLEGLACTGVGDCVATGGYSVTGMAEGMMLTETNGSWAQVTELTSPNNANAGSNPPLRWITPPESTHRHTSTTSDPPTPRSGSAPPTH